MQLYELGVANPLLKYVHDLFDIENEILGSNQKNMIILADYKIEWNPEFSNVKLMQERDLTIAEI